MTQTRLICGRALASAYPRGYSNRVGPTFLTLLLAPFIELWLLIRIGREIGALPLLALLVGSAVLGTLILRLKGQRVLAQTQAALARGQVPEEGILGPALLLLGAILLILPGVLSDVAGLLLIVPFTRKPLMDVLRRALERRSNVARSVHLHGFDFGFSSPFGGAGPGPQPRSQASTADSPTRKVRSQRPRPAHDEHVSRAPTTVGFGPGRATVIVETEGEEICSSERAP